MSMKLLLAKPADGVEGAKLFFEFSAGNTSNKHQLKFHQDNSGYWHPEVKIDLGELKYADLDSLVGEIATILGSASQVIRTQGHIAKGLVALL